MADLKEGDIYLPYADWDQNHKDSIEQYYHNALNWREALNNVYGGHPLTDIVRNIEVIIEDPLDRIITFRLHSIYGVAELSGMSLRQLLVESSYRYGDHAGRDISNWEKDGWPELSAQERVEICQNELSRWSLVVIDRQQKEWPRGIPGEINARNCGWIEYLEIVNNCTTSRGFELKLRVEGDLFHGSFLMPKEPYRLLCQVQSGAWAWQGWIERTPINNTFPSLINPLKPPHRDNPSFSMVYSSGYNALQKLRIDLDVYRDLVPGSEKEYPVTLNRGRIDYTRWGKDKEYFTKPFKRKLVVALEDRHAALPPLNYQEILAPEHTIGAFRLPKFGEDGLYDVLDPDYKEKYPVLRGIDRMVISETTQGLSEIRLVVGTPTAPTSLYQIVIGNLDLDSTVLRNDFLTIDRFCFNPRPTTSRYDHNWRPAAELHGAEKKAIYAFVLGAKLDGESVFIQPESWGIERAILKRDGNRLTVDLISYERIVPVWQGWVEMENEVIA